MKRYRFLIVILTGALVLSGCGATQKSLQTESTQDKPMDAVGRDLKFSGIDLTALSSTELYLPLPLLRTELKKRTREIVEQQDTDGFYVLISGSSPDIAGELLAEAGLLKPYLFTAIVLSEGTDRAAAEKYLASGYADVIADKEELSGNGSDMTIHLSDITRKSDARHLFGLDLSELPACNGVGAKVTINGTEMVTDYKGMISFVTDISDSLLVVTPADTLSFNTSGWFLPYRYTLLSDGSAVRRGSWVEFRNIPQDITSRQSLEILCKTAYPATVQINGDTVKQYKTGIFFKNIVFSDGPNRVRASATFGDLPHAFYEYEFVFRKSDNRKETFPLWIDTETAVPSADIEMLADDIVKVRFQGSHGQEGAVALSPGKNYFSCSRTDYSGFSIYEAEIPLSLLSQNKQYSIKLILSTAAGAPVKWKHEAMLLSSLLVRAPEDFPLVKVINEYSRLTYNTGAPRLGGPVRVEASPGMVFKTNGRSGEYYRVRLSSEEEGFVDQSDVEVVPGKTSQPSYYITSLSCRPAQDADILSIPYYEPVPYEIYPEPEQKRLVVTLFGVQTASTWITHLKGLRVIERITWQQTSPETYRIYINLKTSNIWGYDIRPDGKRLLVSVKYPPEYDTAGEKPLSGLKIAIEAGHGGSNTGAIGLSGLVEKDINLDLSLRLEKILVQMGAEVLQIRDSDKAMTLLEKRDAALRYGADMLISIHANAGGGGYLQTGGTSTYWHNPFWAPLADRIYDRLLELGLGEFGVVGSFNYTVTRASQMPAVLVEQAFMSNAADEEKLADPEFRQREAEKICEGITDYLRYMKE